MGKDQELLEAARSGNIPVVEKILSQRAKRSGPLARSVHSALFWYSFHRKMIKKSVLVSNVDSALLTHFEIR